MSIVVTCENGHRLRAPDRKAGTVGRCPACGAEVKIPEISRAPSDSSILRLLGVGKELRRRMNEYDAEHPAPPESSKKPLDDLGLPPAKQSRKKICPQCDWEIDEGFKICPHCRYYFLK